MTICRNKRRLRGGVAMALLRGPVRRAVSDALGVHRPRHAGERTRSIAGSLGDLLIEHVWRESCLAPGEARRGSNGVSQCDARALSARTGRTDATRVTVTIDDRPQTIFVDATTGAVRGIVDDRHRIYVMANLLHGTLLLGNWGDALIEIAASLGILSDCVWPVPVVSQRGHRSGSRSESPAPRRRLAWRDLHKITGVILAPVLALHLIAGFAWTDVWGGQFVQTWSTLAATNAAPGESASHHETLNAGSSKVVPWNLEQTPLPSFSRTRVTADHARCRDRRRPARGYWPAILGRRADAMQMASGPSHRQASTMTSMIRGRNSPCTWIGTRGALWAMEAGTSTAQLRERWPRGSRFIWVRSDGGTSSARVCCAYRCSP